MPYVFPSVDDFKAQFARDFPFANPGFGAYPGAVVLAGGALSSIAAGTPGQGYTSAPSVQVLDPTGTGAVVTATILNGAVTGWVIGTPGTGYTAPTFLVSGGSGSTADLSRVMDVDVTGAFVDAQFNFNPALFPSQATFSRAFGFLTAHCLVERLLAAGEGLRSRGTWLAQSKGVGDVSESYAIPQRVLEDPFLSSIASTRYGKRYLEIISPLLAGNFATFPRITPP